MVFSSLVFLLLFLPGTVLLYRLMPGTPAKNALLTAASLLFYAWGEPLFVLVMVGSIFLNFVLGLFIDRNEGRKRRLFFILALVCNLGLLGVFKYAGFVLSNIYNLIGIQAVPPSIFLPLGISFFTFQALSYIIDLYNKKVEAQRHFFRLLLYISFFPQLIAGPIVRYETIQLQITRRSVSLLDIGEGVRRFLLGLFKKVLLANQLAVMVDEVFAKSFSAATATTWLAIGAYALQIYFDFSGYSDMAIGLGRMFGFHFDENFDYPYIARSATEFWRRWHISLGSWFRDYLYIPLGGSRRGLLITCRNLFVVWFLTGLWHGASWNFVAWGLYFAFFLLIERLFLKKPLEKFPLLGHIYLPLVALFGWVLFRSETLAYAGQYVKRMLLLDGPGLANGFTLVYLQDYWFLLLFGVLASTKLFKLMADWAMRRFAGTFELVRGVVYAGAYLLVLVMLVNSTYNPFIYFRF